ncbi:hypothetical protein Q2T83_01480 [Fervidibacter sacchari]|uniref:Uncharacterized protein n=1 Tax=Candidatus Fervidibacter sacchari TaxID=1448929 RepID=A0ABT2EU10_9BACT|nr:hypothetical protein [Candidatus Fervidibacter sacchari]MCS3921144.1 hypothetical protein [Candidatus Fervidibacter sacchari]WKU16508.1 hypothetical protein Q2T83_01480 [Candidatus Fervidibacter sacchari]
MKIKESARVVAPPFVLTQLILFAMNVVTPEKMIVQRVTIAAQLVYGDIMIAKKALTIPFNAVTLLIFQRWTVRIMNVMPKDQSSVPLISESALNSEMRADRKQLGMGVGIVIFLVW